ncbi:hypothetical protein A2331_03940 [Candidatus Falkowbacteria bacterium RIFOXYB2_FULL_34_18]|uniref:Uncharacterized protein n=1 Tax=Candidatus Falkowbacteria bacterium RIFOXYD2_FULL_34_120 TaxID=1798007 RepID=A0A1F5TP76_9BACT|nr:MAG: hypothetical protein A2331_03940 [Candidatus Falkowbacteria bacterium RIFOXYB2_FULL_34_18]OGF29102.1 MAG: hypothetical protein A2500_03265 [Candidatus Falkowbacteria bacterium RIFOXYC12_FULL_34_55]OGF36185.1 MAG: hypothetical protein A2466_04795 [Candidatus Falkowbacteria bacterium RIFOXYC2_FULL_34_220]OGF38612.1 MAG: hypothetical protein A2515_02155 [Candidatus Falkowbacteria bacterium RIFOXYD12_FULL_34_57]OGF40795.1 MAG: hypothetical protein A2531_06800 [Candidatus Falkowbacteria bact
MKRKIIIIILVTISILILLSVVWFYFIFIRPFPLQKASQIGNLEVKVEKNNSIGENIFQLTGVSVDSALWCDSYKIKYNRSSVNLFIYKTLRDTGCSHKYFIQFPISNNVNEVYLGESELLWSK